MAKSNEMTIGPFGGNVSDNLWEDGRDFTGVRGIRLSHNMNGIGSFQVIYDDNGAPVEGQAHSVPGATFTREVIKFDFPNERLVRVDGYIGSASPKDSLNYIVRSLTFTTNKKNQQMITTQYGPYGPEIGIKFSIPIPSGGNVVGFFGSTDNDYLHALGFYVKV